MSEAAPVVLCIASQVTAEHIGLGGAIPVLALSGIEAWPLPTVILSGHAAVPGVRRAQHGSADVTALMSGLEASGAVDQIDAILIGYLGTPEVAGAVADFVGRARKRRPVRVILDPVLGDNGRLYLPEAVGEVIRTRLLPESDVLVPNLFELGWLTGRAVQSPAQAAAAARSLLGHGPSAIFVTSVTTEHGIGILTVTPDGASLAEAPKVPRALNGAGDVTAALLTAAVLKGQAPEDAAAHATGIAGALARAAEDLGRSDMPVIAARNCILSPPPPAPVLCIGPKD